jgi:hypothetical protein
MPALTTRTRFTPGNFTEEEAPLPFSMLAPNAELVDMHKQMVQGQIVAQN